MQDVQKLPRFYPSFGNLAKKKGKKKKARVGWMSDCTHLCVRWRTSRTLLSAQLNRFQIFPCMIQLISQHPALTFTCLTWVY